MRAPEDIVDDENDGNALLVICEVNSNSLDCHWASVSNPTPGRQRGNL
jgi:hypothetical protein